MEIRVRNVHVSRPVHRYALGAVEAPYLLSPIRRIVVVGVGARALVMTVRVPILAVMLRGTPDGDHLAAPAELLDAIVASVRHIDAALAVHCDRVRKPELARARARPAPPRE